MSEEPGSVGEEAAKLVAAVQDWARAVFGDAATSHVATGAPECRYCPVCQLIAVLRGDRPDVAEHLADVGSTVVTALRGLLDAAHDPAPGHRRVQRVDFGAGETAPGADDTGSGE